MFEEDEPENKEWIHESDLPDLDHCKDMVKGCLECLYESGDIYKMEDMLEELSHQLGVKFELGIPQLAHKDKNRLLNYTLGYQRANLDRTQL